MKRYPTGQRWPLRIATALAAIMRLLPLTGSRSCLPQPLLALTAALALRAFVSLDALAPMVATLLFALAALMAGGALISAELRAARDLVRCRRCPDLHRGRHHHSHRARPDGSACHPLGSTRVTDRINRGINPHVLQSTTFNKHVLARAPLAVHPNCDVGLDVHTEWPT